MAVSKRKNRQGVVTGYQVTVTAPDRKTGKKARVVIGTYLRRKEADAAERKAKIGIDNGTFALERNEPPEIITVESACNLWIATKKLTLRPNTMNGYENALNNHVLPAFGSVPITELTHDDIQRTVSAWSDAGKGAQTISRAVMVLRGALARQVRAGVLAANPAEGVEKPSPSRRPKEFVMWSEREGEVQAFLDVASKHYLAPFWFFTALEGLRRGEALALRWSDLTWSDNERECVASIRQTIVPDLAQVEGHLCRTGQRRGEANARFS